MSPALSFFVPGTPAPGGSKSAFPIFRKGPDGEKVFVRSIITDAAGQKNKDWRANVGWTGREAMGKAGLRPFAGPLEVSFAFTMPRLKSHRKPNGELRGNAPVWHVTKPDTTKLIRSTEDALKGIAWLDDSQIARQAGSKQYGDSPGCLITIRSLEILLPTLL